MVSSGQTTIDQSGTERFLADPATHGGAPVTRLSTHISRLFLAGTRAYKLKRAVSFSYLDFSTPERRHAACLAELKLNRRTAPALYRAVRAVTQAPDGSLALDGDGTPIDWVVEMTRFDQATLFDRMAESGALTPDLMTALADEIARFHATTPVVTTEGGAAGLAAVIAANDLNLRLAVPDGLDAASVDAVTHGARHELDRLAALLDHRRGAGKVRHCHGDLHLGNICLIDGKPTLFDCIEFNDLFATNDVLYDLAFLLMDLAHRGATGLANRVLNCYLDQTDEAGGLAALPLFQSVRAAIRAHVAAAAARGEDDAGKRAERAEASRAYLALARRLLDPPHPRVVAIGGFSGTGKSTLAAALAPALGLPPGARILRSDVLRKQHFGVPPTARLPPAAYRAEVSAKIYETMRREAAGALGSGVSVVLDAVAARPEERDAFVAVARGAGVPFTGLWLEGPPPVLAARIAARRGDASDANEAVLREQLEYDLGRLDWTRIEAGRGAAATLAHAHRLLGLETETS